MNRLAMALLMVLPLVTSDVLAGPCANAGNITYAWSWCTGESSEDSPIAKVCFGTMSVGMDTLFRAIEIQMKSSDVECIYASNSGGTNSFPQNCPKLVERTYYSVSNSAHRTQIRECVSDGFAIWVEGQTLTGLPFQSRPQL